MGINKDDRKLDPMRKDARTLITITRCLPLSVPNAITPPDILVNCIWGSGGVLNDGGSAPWLTRDIVWVQRKGNWLSCFQRSASLLNSNVLAWGAIPLNTLAYGPFQSKPRYPLIGLICNFLSHSLHHLNNPKIPQAKATYLNGKAMPQATSLRSYPLHTRYKFSHWLRKYQR